MTTTDTFTVYGDYAMPSEIALHSDPDLRAAIRWANSYTSRGMGGYTTIEVIWESDSAPRAAAEWLKSAEVEA
jgi:hypothetical protein